MRQTYYTPEHLLTERVQIDVVGAGGNGSALLDSLASLQSTLMAVGHPGFDVTVYDPDTVSHANLGRQRFTGADVGMNKAVILIHRINAFYGLNWTARPQTYDAYGKADMVISCVDSAAARVQIGRCGCPGALWLDLGNDAAEGQVVLGHFGSDRYRLMPSRANEITLPSVLDLHPELREADDQDDGPSCSVEAAVRRQEWPVNRVAATHAATLLWQLFRKGQTDWQGVTFTLEPPTVAPIHIDPVVWAMYGHEPETEAA